MVEERSAGKSREHSVKEGVSHSSDEEDEKTGQGGKATEATGASDLDSSRSLRIVRMPPVSEREKEEEDEGYTAGSSEDIESSQTHSVPSAHGGSNKPPTESHEIEDKPGNDDEKRKGVSPDRKPARHIGLYLSSGTHDAESDTTEEGEIREIIDNDSDSDRDAPPCRSSAAKHAFLNYDGCSDNPAHEPPASRQCASKYHDYFVSREAGQAGPHCFSGPGS
ncbi:hypothetical protein B0J12DRAFT_234945 [Macrophomina phaseolina]|uniref:Uncharacterized protein n=1 Tax=Macrophomina phaseolina TaxID=35725 RepID=A0ABQ8GQ82_9PEZI|nr:hypothetical protein B0J12DRAFT_234945 [Macrophomina phaseolina]